MLHLKNYQAVLMVIQGLIILQIKHLFATLNKLSTLNDNSYDEAFVWDPNWTINIEWKLMRWSICLGPNIYYPASYAIDRL